MCMLIIGNIDKDLTTRVYKFLTEYPACFTFFEFYFEKLWYTQSQQNTTTIVSKVLENNHVTKYSKQTLVMVQSIAAEAVLW